MLLMHASPHVPSLTSSEAASWNMYKANNSSVENGSNAASLATSSSLGSTNTQSDYIGYNSHSNSADPYSYMSMDTKVTIWLSQQPNSLTLSQQEHISKYRCSVSASFFISYENHNEC
ncbi:putative leukocyte receptor cluster (lrc) member [Corchorus olitorius]|uniref:Leukocyte receptor cluster (Lrc) member n=1 Tax=Corchorus olitorius TaxID=93759 RepID=A0A1R3KZ32_9ROSI|nr:putative leukocyte receptor cluster (lrc) member [Corchorus olitorius]